MYLPAALYLSRGNVNVTHTRILRGVKSLIIKSPYCACYYHYSSISLVVVGAVILVDVLSYLLLLLLFL